MTDSSSAPADARPIVPVNRNQRRFGLVGFSVWLASAAVALVDGVTGLGHMAAQTGALALLAAAVVLLLPLSADVPAARHELLQSAALLVVGLMTVAPVAIRTIATALGALLSVLLVALSTGLLAGGSFLAASALRRWWLEHGAGSLARWWSVVRWLIAAFGFVMVLTYLAGAVSGGATAGSGGIGLRAGPVLGVLAAAGGSLGVAAALAEIVSSARSLLVLRHGRSR